MTKNITSFKKGHKGFWKGKTMATEHKKKISISNLGKSNCNSKKWKHESKINNVMGQQQTAPQQ